MQRTAKTIEDRLPQGADRKTRIAVWVITLGLMNFLGWSVGYLLIGGEAVHGAVRKAPDGDRNYYLRSYAQEDVRVSKATFLYSGVHSISIWPTVAAVMLSMLTLAKDRIVSSMHATIVRGQTFITVLATIIVLMVALATILFIGKFVHLLTHATPYRASATTVALQWL